MFHDPWISVGSLAVFSILGILVLPSNNRVRFLLVASVSLCDLVGRYASVDGCQQASEPDGFIECKEGSFSHVVLQASSLETLSSKTFLFSTRLTLPHQSGTQPARMLLLECWYEELKRGPLFNHNEDVHIYIYVYICIYICAVVFTCVYTFISVHT